MIIQTLATRNSPISWMATVGWLVVQLSITNCALFAAQVQDSKVVLVWGKKGDKEGEFFSPIQIVVNRNDEVLVTDLNNARLQKFTTEGKYLGGFALPLDTPPRKSCIIGGLAVDDAGLVYLSFMNQNKIGVFVDRHERVSVSSLNDRVQMFTVDGKFLFEVGGPGKELGQFARPHGLAMNSKGHFYVADSGNQRIQKFDVSGLKN